VYGPVGVQLSSVPSNIRFHGEVEYANVPRILGEAKRFVFLPGAEESFSRTTVEAWAAGCELVVDKSLIGAMWWLENAPEKIDKQAAIPAFWELIECRLT
jgi:hypothetical protein